jgi:tetratricopeptide (TPR) repeat protein
MQTGNHIRRFIGVAATRLGPAAAVALVLCGAASPLLAQKKGQEFVRQGMLITSFSIAPGVPHKLAKDAADAVRSRVANLSNKHEVDVTGGTEITTRLERASYRTDTALDARDIRLLGRALRSDEYVVGRVEAAGQGTVRLSGSLVLMRDPRLIQPLPDAVGTGLDEAAAAMARSIVAARSQAVPMRRCENGVRDRNVRTALAEARAGVAAYPRATLVGTCLVWALQASGSPIEEVLGAAERVLAVDSTSYHALGSAAVALDSLRRHDEAARYWLRLARTDTTDLELATRVLSALAAAGSWKQAEAFAIKVSDAHPDNLPLLRFKWRSAYENRHWVPALAAGEIMAGRDSEALGDPAFFRRLATAYRANGQPVAAVQVAARGVTAFPKEASLYALYTQFVREEADTVLPRGLALFPKSAELLALNAKQLRTQGKVAESLESMKSAMAADSTLDEGQLMIAQAEIDLGRPDSALAALRVALAHGEDSTRVAQFAFARGNALYRAANGTKTSTDFALALRFLSFADSVRVTPQSRFLVGAAALGVAQRALTEAPSDKDRIHSCQLAQLGSQMIPVARSGIEAGQEVMPDAAKQSLDYLTQIEPYAGKQVAAFCAVN